jgi:hypothetical protein
MAERGRPPIWDDPEAFSKAVDEYFEQDIQHTWTGLAYHLGFESRKSLWEYGTKEEFSNPVKRALLRIEEMYEKALFNKNAAGPIFALKNFNWQDKQQIEHEGLPEPAPIHSVRIIKDVRDTGGDKS